MIANLIKSHYLNLFIGSGKSHTIEGGDKDPGVMINSVEYLINSQKGSLEIKCSITEIYNEKLTDLLRDVSDGDESVCIRSITSISGSTEKRLVNMKEVPIRSLEDFIHAFTSAKKRRKVAATQRNNGSSRSHAILQFNLKGKINDKIFESNLMIVDLAGAENANDHLSTGDTAMRATEMNKINKSLCTFGAVIQKLKANEIADYRSSLLTQLLKESLTANTKTLLLTTISQEKNYFSSSKHSLCQAEMAKGIKITNVKPNFATVTSIDKK